RRRRLAGSVPAGYGRGALGPDALREARRPASANAATDCPALRVGEAGGRRAGSADSRMAPPPCVARRARWPREAAAAVPHRPRLEWQYGADVRSRTPE